MARWYLCKFCYFTNTIFNSRQSISTIPKLWLHFFLGNVHYLNIFYIAGVEEAVIIYENVKRPWRINVPHSTRKLVRRDFIFGKNSFDIIYILVVKVGKSIQLKQRWRVHDWLIRAEWHSGRGRPQNMSAVSKLIVR